MEPTNKNIMTGIAIFAAILATFSIYSYMKSPEKMIADSENTQMPNPASLFCEQSGGVRSDSASGGSSNCSFSTGESCEEWDLFRGDCDVVGISETYAYANASSAISVTYRIREGVAILHAEQFGVEVTSLRPLNSSQGVYMSDDGKISIVENNRSITLIVDEKVIFHGDQIEMTKG